MGISGCFFFLIAYEILNLISDSAILVLMNLKATSFFYFPWRMQGFLREKRQK